MYFWKQMNPPGKTQIFQALKRYSLAWNWMSNLVPFFQPTPFFPAETTRLEMVDEILGHNLHLHQEEAYLSEFLKIYIKKTETIPTAISQAHCLAA